jgi:predicted PurR-regulated permease PerM
MTHPPQRDQSDQRDPRDQRGLDAPGGPVIVTPPDRTAIEVVWSSVWVRAITFVVLAVVLLYLLVTQRHVYGLALQVGLIGFLVAYIFNPVVEALVRARFPRAVAVIVVYLLLLQVFVFGSILLTQVVAETARFIALVPNALENLGGTLSRLALWWGSFVETLPEFLQERFGFEGIDEDIGRQAQEQVAFWLTSLAQGLNRFLQRVVTDGPTVLLAGATGFLSATFQVVLITIASAYFLVDYGRITANMRRYVPVRWRPVHDRLAFMADRAVGGYLRGRLLTTIILGFLVWIGLSLSGVPLATAISFLAAVFNLVPYLGPVVGTIPAVLLGFTVSPLTALLALLVFIVVNQIEAHVLGPLILARSTDIHPVTVLISIMIGIGAMGVLGAFIAVPIAAMGKMVLEEYLLTRPAYRDVEPVEAPPPEARAPEEPPPERVTESPLP